MAGPLGAQEGVAFVTKAGAKCSRTVRPYAVSELRSVDATNGTYFCRKLFD
jgi:hypothetical protein